MAQRGGTGLGENNRWRIEPTVEWEQMDLLCGWPEQRDYEFIRPLVLFGSSRRDSRVRSACGRRFAKKGAGGV